MRAVTVFLFLGLTACGTVPNVVNSPANPITRDRLARAEATFNDAQRLVLVYRGWPACKSSETTSFTNRCRKYSIYQNLRTLNRKVNSAFEIAEQCIRDQSSNVDCVAGIEGAVGNFIGAALATGAK